GPWGASLRHGSGRADRCGKRAARRRAAAGDERSLVVTRGKIVPVDRLLDERRRQERHGAGRPFTPRPPGRDRRERAHLRGWPGKEQDGIVGREAWGVERERQIASRLTPHASRCFL